MRFPCSQRWAWRDYVCPTNTAGNHFHKLRSAYQHHLELHSKARSKQFVRILRHFKASIRFEVLRVKYWTYPSCMLFQCRCAFSGADIPDLCHGIRWSWYKSLTIWEIVETPDSLFVSFHCLQTFTARIPHFDWSIVGAWSILTILDRIDADCIHRVFMFYISAYQFKCIIIPLVEMIGSRKGIPRSP